MSRKVYGYYDPRNWKEGDRVKPNLNYDWSISARSRDKLDEMRGKVVLVNSTRLKVLWDDGLTAFYSYADSSLINLSNRLPDELFEI